MTKRIEIFALDVRRSAWLSGPVDVFYQLSLHLPPEFHTHMLCVIPSSVHPVPLQSTTSVTLERISAPNILTCIPMRYLIQRCRKADIIVTLGNAAPILLMSAIYARLFHKAHIMVPTGVYSHPLVIAQRGPLCRWANWLLKLIVAKKACVLAKSEMELKDLKRAGFSGRIPIIPNCFDFNRMKQAVDQLCNSINHSTSRARTVTYVGRLNPNKGTMILLNAWRLVSNRFQSARLRIVGFDSEEHCTLLQRTANELGISHTVNFVGQLPKDEVFREMAEADIVVFPSLGDNFGSVVAEALGCGTPVIVTQNCPWKHLGTLGCGWVVEAEADELADAIVEGMNCSKQKLVDMGRVGQKYVRRHFSLDVGCSRLTELYKSLTINSFALRC